MDLNELWASLQKQINIIKNQTEEEHHSAIDKAFKNMQTTVSTFIQEQVIEGLAQPHPRSRVYCSEPKHWQIHDLKKRDLLEKIKDKIKKSSKAPACIFDLDGTLFDVGYRTLGIINEWIHTSKSSKYEPHLIQKLTKINYNHIGYALSHAFENAGFNLRTENVADLFTAVESYWKKRFFDGKTLLQYDQTFKNSASFVHDIHATGVHIYYLTGRYLNTMYEGTIEQLKKFSMPLKNASVVLKANSQWEDQIYKASMVKEFSVTHEIVANFENEYVNLAFMAEEIPNALNTIIDFHHSGRPVPQLNHPIYRIRW